MEYGWKGHSIYFKIPVVIPKKRCVCVCRGVGPGSDDFFSGFLNTHYSLLAITERAKVRGLRDLYFFRFLFLCRVTKEKGQCAAFGEWRISIKLYSTPM